jgi:hypothetical protein
MYRFDLTDAQWERIASFFPDRYHHGRAGHPWKDHRPLVNGIRFGRRELDRCSSGCDLANRSLAAVPGLPRCRRRRPCGWPPGRPPNAAPPPRGLEPSFGCNAWRAGGQRNTSGAEGLNAEAGLYLTGRVRRGRTEGSRGKRAS